MKTVILVLFLLTACGGDSSPQADATPAPSCGDNACNGAETCATCPSDCGACPPSCGDATCNGAETCATCPSDCGACPPSCGDATCNGTETCTSCPGDCGACPPSCGDATCNGTETCTSCPGDCGACPPGGCIVADPVCVGETICVSNVCESAWNRSYTITVNSVTVPSTNGGSAWDALGGAPDPYVVVSLNGATVLTTTAASDVFSATYGTNITVTIPSNSALVISIYDEDVSADDYVGGCQLDPLEADVVDPLEGMGVFYCDFGYTISATIALVL